MLSYLRHPIDKSQGPIFFWLLAILLPIFAVIPALVNPIEEHAYDTAEFHIYRAAVFSAARADGSFYPRWVQSLNAGLGGPFFSIYPSMVYFLMDLEHSAGIPLTVAWRMLVAMAFVLGSVGMFGLGQVLFRRADVALGSATLFTYSTFLIRDLFERGAPGGLSLALFPMTLWSVALFAEKPSGWRLLLGSLSFMMTISIHSQTAFLLAPLALILVIFLLVRFGIKHAARSIAPLIGGALLAAFYLIPFPFEVKYVQFENANQIDYANPVINPLTLQDIFALPPMFDTGIGNNVIPEAAGALLYGSIALLGLAVAGILLKQRKNSESLLVAGTSLLSIAVIWLQLDSATPIWSTFSALSVFLFRWRLLVILAVTSAVIAGFALMQLSNSVRPIGVIAVIGTYLLLHATMLYPQLFFRYTSFSPSPTVAEAQATAMQNNAYGLSSFDEFLPIWRIAPFTPAEFAQVEESAVANLPPGAHILHESRHNDWSEMTLETPTPFVGAFHVLYYPGWVGYVDGTRMVLGNEDGTGYITMQVPTGTHVLQLRYEGTLLQHIGNAVTITATIALVLLTLFWRGPKVTGVPVDYPAPCWSLVALILCIAGIKTFIIDPQTTLFRSTSSCSAIAGDVVQMHVVFGENLRLCGYAFSETDFHPGDQLSITLYWQSERRAATPANTFVHLLGTTINPETNNLLWGQQDKLAPGQHALALWQTGKLYRDQYTFRISPSAPPGAYQLEIGWWQPSDNQRLKTRLVSPSQGWSVSAIDSLIFSPIRVR